MTFCVSGLSAQTDTLLTELPTTKDEFIESEKRVLATINWLESTPLDQEEDKRKSQYALLTAWIINSPTVTIEVNSKTLTFNKKNDNLLMFYMAGWSRYALLNHYSKDVVQGNLAGIRMAMGIYKKGVGVKKDKEMEKLIKLEENGELEKWVKDQLGKQ